MGLLAPRRVPELRHHMPQLQHVLDAVVAARRVRQRRAHVHRPEAQGLGGAEVGRAVVHKEAAARVPLLCQPHGDGEGAGGGLAVLDPHAQHVHNAIEDLRGRAEGQQATMGPGGGLGGEAEA